MLVTYKVAANIVSTVLKLNLLNITFSFSGKRYAEGCICGFFARGAVESRSEGRDLGVVSQLNKEETQQFLEECQREAYNASHLQSGCKHCKHGVEVESTQYNLLIFRQTVDLSANEESRCDVPIILTKKRRQD
eukprot:gene9016-9951_t